MGKEPSAFKRADYIRAVKAAQAAGLQILKSELHPDGRVVLYHQATPNQTADNEPAGFGLGSEPEVHDEVADLRMLPQSHTLPDVCSPPDLAKAWGCSARHVRRLMSTGELPSFRVGKKLLRVRGDVAAAYEARNRDRLTEAQIGSGAPTKLEPLKRLDLQRIRPPKPYRPRQRKATKP